MALKTYNLHEIPEALEGDTAYSNLEAMLASGGLGIFLVRNATELGFNIGSRRGRKIIEAAGFIAGNAVTTVYGRPPDEEPPSLHHDHDFELPGNGEVQVVHHHRTLAGKSRGLFIPVISPVGLYLDGYADFDKSSFDTDVFGTPGYEGVIGADDEVLFVGTGPGFMAHRFMTLPEINSHRVAQLTFIDRKAA